MAATSRPTLTQYNIGDVATVKTNILTTTLTNINSVTSALTNAQLTDLPQRTEYFQTQFEAIGANMQFTIQEIIVTAKDRGLR